jgi:dihydroflavonol-4-reductase
VTVCITGSTGFIGAHVAKLASETFGPPRVTYRDEARLTRLGDMDVEPVKADVLDRAALRRAFRGCEVVFHAAGLVSSRPAELVWQVNALAPRIAVEAAAAEGVRRVVVTSSVAGIGPAPADRPGTEDDVYAGWGLGLTYPDAKHEGESEALAAGARLGVEVVVVNPSYVFGAPIDRSQPGETSTRTIGNYLRGRLPAVLNAPMNFVDVEDVALGHLLAADKGKPGERYILGGQNLTWPALIDRIADISGVRYPVLVLPREVSYLARLREALGLPGIMSNEGYELMGQEWSFSSRKAERELGYRSRTIDETLHATIEWYHELIDAGAFDDAAESGLSRFASVTRTAAGIGLFEPVKVGQRVAGRRLVAGL